ncbi:MAG: hypothetical protein ABI400_02295 [Lacisediminihabitans sp.]
MELTDNTDLLKQIEALKLKGEKLQRDNATTTQDILALLGLAEQGAVTVTFDEDGLMSELDIDAEARADMTAEQLLHEINAGILRAGALVRGITVSDADPRAQLNASGSLVAKLVQSIASGERPEPQKIKNDFGTVTITALMGTVTGVECQTSWIGSTPDHLISEEIVRMARTAAQQTDTMGRYA